MKTLGCVAQQHDIEFYERELASFIPDKVFDAHCHLWTKDGIPFLIDGEDHGDVGHEQACELMEDLYPQRKKGFLFISFADPKAPKTADRMNEWVSHQTQMDPLCRGEFFVRPTDDPEWVRQEVRRLGLHGLKCYHTFATTTQPTWEAEIPEFLPEKLVKIAHEEGLCITLHMVRSRALADPSNIHWIRHYCETYPQMTLILAHSARGFQPAHNFEGLPKLTGLPNLYFDSSANCEPLAHQAIIRLMGHDKMLYGGDLPVTHLRGRSVAAADSYLWLYKNSSEWQENHMTIDPVLIGLEHLRSLKWACWSEKLSDAQVEDIFWNNAEKLFHL